MQRPASLPVLVPGVAMRSAVQRSSARAAACARSTAIGVPGPDQSLTSDSALDVQWCAVDVNV